MIFLAYSTVIKPDVTYNVLVNFKSYAKKLIVSAKSLTVIGVI